VYSWLCVHGLSNLKFISPLFSLNLEVHSKIAKPYFVVLMAADFINILFFSKASLSKNYLWVKSLKVSFVNEYDTVIHLLMKQICYYKNTFSCVRNLKNTLSILPCSIRKVDYLWFLNFECSFKVTSVRIYVKWHAMKAYWGYESGTPQNLTRLDQKVSELVLWY
jgi:hypothetical protein